mmetsp:Transcript_24406/g.30553  ORF Transcript_24406/g.30553 Transcript_24406/m.30553 type:complete len:248 (-) Transcript_24406:255-998(-)
MARVSIQLFFLIVHSVLLSANADQKKSPEAGDSVYEPPDFPAFIASIVDTSVQENNIPVFSASAQGPSPKQELPQVGDLLSKISGRATCNLPFKTVVAAIRDSSRPIVLHFIGSGRLPSTGNRPPLVTATPPGTLAPPPTAMKNNANTYVDDPFSSTPHYPPPPSSVRAFARLPETQTTWGQSTAAARHARNDTSENKSYESSVAAAERSLFEDPQPSRQQISKQTNTNLFVDDNPFSTPDDSTITL